MAVGLVGGASLMQFGFIPSCESILTRFDLCGTVLANCTPGTFDLLFADIPDYDCNDGACDLTCTIPGGCDDANNMVDPFVDPFGNQGPTVDIGP